MEQGNRLYRIWYAMKQRCYNEKHVGFKYYGAKGVTVCKEWLDSFEVFEVWALLNGYSPDLSLDRGKNGKGYTPENCRWVTWAVQMQNRKNPNPTRKGMTYKKEKVNLKQLAENLGVCAETLRKRLKKGQPIEAPIRKYSKK